MRVAVIAFFLCAGSSAFCQTAALGSTSPNNFGLILPPTMQPVPDYTKTSRVWRMSDVVPLSSVTSNEPREGFARRTENTQIDPGMIVRPPKSSIGVQPPGTLIAQNLYPGLRLLPIGESKAKHDPTPTE